MVMLENVPAKAPVVVSLRIRRIRQDSFGVFSKYGFDTFCVISVLVSLVSPYLNKF